MKVRGTDPLLPYLFGGDAPLLAVVEKVLGADVKPHRLGSMIAEPTSRAQGSHRDSPHLYPDFHSPPHIMSLFLPLIDVSLEHGPTDFWPGSHKCGSNNNKDSTAYGDDPSIPKVQFLTRLGDAIAFDYRIVHRGAPNDSEDTRPDPYSIMTLLVGGLLKNSPLQRSLVLTANLTASQRWPAALRQRKAARLRRKRSAHEKHED